MSMLAVPGLTSAETVSDNHLALLARNMVYPAPLWMFDRSLFTLTE